MPFHPLVYVIAKTVLEIFRDAVSIEMNY